MKLIVEKDLVRAQFTILIRAGMRRTSVRPQDMDKRSNIADYGGTELFGAAYEENDKCGKQLSPHTALSTRSNIPSSLGHDDRNRTTGPIFARRAIALQFTAADHDKH